MAENWLIVPFVIETGLRLTEQFHSRWDCLNAEQGILTIPLRKSGKTSHVLTDAALEIVKGLTSWMHVPFYFQVPSPRDNRCRLARGRLLSQGTHREPRVQIPNGTRQTTEQSLSFAIDLLVEAA